LQQAVPAPIPVVLAVPHAGRSYPPALLAAMRHPAQAARRLEDRLVDLVAQAVARQTGAALLIARAPRAMIDLNRAPDDLDREMIVPDPALPIPTRAAQRQARRAQSGLGLVPRRLAGLGEIWRQRTPAADVQAQNRPDPRALSPGAVGRAVRPGRALGAALMIDLHSMPRCPAAMRPNRHRLTCWAIALARPVPAR
jgi:N-formylglutamate amidohydrolase